MVELRKESNPTRWYIANLTESAFKAQVFPLSRDPHFSAIASECRTDEDVQYMKAKFAKVLPSHLIQTDDDVLNAVVATCRRINDGLRHRPGIDF